MTVTRRSYLLDTNVLIWLSSDLTRIPASVLRELETFDSDVYVSTVCFWEIAIKQRLGKIDTALRLEPIVSDRGIRELTISSRYVDALRELPLMHGDRFDRMMVAQAIVERLVLVTADRRLTEYAVTVMLI